MFIKNRTRTDHIIIVSTKTSPTDDLTVRDLERQHRNQGCVSIRHHYIIRRDGMVETGRELDKMGNHRRSYNKNSVYVLLVGDKDNFTDEQFESLQDIEEELRDLYPEADVLDLT